MTDALLRFVRRELKKRAEKTKAGPMAAYMKTDDPFHGVQKPGRNEVFRALVARFPITSRAAYREAVEALFAQPYREERYLACALAVHHERYVTLASVPLYRRMIVRGAWWDTVDTIAPQLVGKALLDNRAKLKPKLDRWADHDDMWLRRSALICQLKHKAQTDEAWLFDLCLRRAHEKEFFIRKAIGWTLREYAKTEPERVRDFLLEHRDRWSGLSFREAAKHLDVT